MTELLAQIIEEVGPISQESIELLLEQFEKASHIFCTRCILYSPVLIIYVDQRKRSMLHDGT